MLGHLAKVEIEEAYTLALQDGLTIALSEAQPRCATSKTAVSSGIG
ncbi:hypothetical protein ACGFNU_14525 [Spirillospora sp. NPDC048911]